MRIDDILRPKAPCNRFLEPTDVAVTTYDPAADGVRPLRVVPGKVTTYFHRRLIDKVFKVCFGRRLATRAGHAPHPDDYYVLVATDGTRFHVNFHN